MANDSTQSRAGFLYAVAAYGAWGLVPLYFNSVACPPKEIVAHRVLWSALLLGVILTLARRWPVVVAVVRNRRTLLMLLVSAYLVAGNWYVYIYSTTSGQITQASLGYFLLPLVNAFAGVAVFKERLRTTQAIALALAGCGVLYMAVSIGAFPWISMTLAVSFALYGVVRKMTPVDGVVGLGIETALLAPTAVVLLAVIGQSDAGLAFGHGGRRLDVLIALSGVVTTFPLVCFAQAVRRLPLISLGFLQFLSPSLQLVVAVTVYDEEFRDRQAISFGLIWLGLAVFAADGIRAVRAGRAIVEEEPEPRLAEANAE